MGPPPALFDDNTTLIILALISTFGVALNTIIGFLALRYTNRVAVSSRANSAKLDDMSHAVNGITQARVDDAINIGELKAQVAKAEGVAEERARTTPPPIIVTTAPIVSPPSST